MNILLTGGTGFLGSHMLRMLLSCGKGNVVLLKRSSSSLDRISHLMPHKSLFVYDMDRTPLPEIFREQKVDTILHVATEYGRGNSSCVKAIETNLVFPVQLIEEGIKHGLVSFINTDSYFNKDNFSYAHLIDYSLSKKVFLNWLRHFSRQIKVCNMVLEHIYGEGDSKEKFVPMLIDAVAVNPKERLPLTFGHQKRDFIHVSDVVSAYKAALDFTVKNNFRFKEFEVGSGVSTSIRSLAELIKDISKSGTSLDFGALPYRDDEIMNSFADPIELRNIGWTPLCPLKEGLARTINFALGRTENVEG